MSYRQVNGTWLTNNSKLSYSLTIPKRQFNTGGDRFLLFNEYHFKNNQFISACNYVVALLAIICIKARYGLSDFRVFKLLKCFPVGEHFRRNIFKVFGHKH